MLIICENHNGYTPQTAVPYSAQWARAAHNKTAAYVRFSGSKRLPAGIYLQRYQPMWELGRREPFYVAQPLYLDDLVQETANADHPGDQS